MGIPIMNRLMLWLSKQVKEFKDSDFYRYLKRFLINIKVFFIRIKYWFSWYNTLKYADPWDWSSILRVEQKQIKCVRDSVQKANNYEGCEHDIRHMNLALKLISIILEEESITELIEPCQVNPDIFSLERKWRCTKYVNTHNASRFLNSYTVKNLSNPKHSVFLQGTLYREKAWQLYYKLRTYFTRRWWW